MVSIETLRLIMRPLKVKDARHLYLLNQDEKVLKYTGDVPFENIESARIFLENYDQYKEFKVGRMAVIRKIDGIFLGWCGLKYNIAIDEYDLGFRFFRQFWNMGYATESAISVVEYGFNSQNIPFIVGKAMEHNLASIRVLQKTGMSLIKYFDFEGAPGVYYRIDNPDKD